MVNFPALPPSPKGRAITSAALSAASTDATDLLTSNLHRTSTGDLGWYRQLNRLDRIGVVATGQALKVFGATGVPAPHMADVVAALIRKQRPSGAWPFITGLASEDVVDATAWAALGLLAVRGAPSCAAVSKDIDESVALATDWLAGAASTQGSWGITPSSAPRVYSTSLAIRTLSATGGNSTDAVAASGAQWLLSVADAQTGAWRDARSNLTVPTTSQAILALVAARSTQVAYRHEVERAVAWLRSIAVESKWWLAAPYAGFNEEVEVTLGKTPIRIEYRHSPRAAAIEALCSADSGLDLVTLPMAEMVEQASRGEWSRMSGEHLPDVTSWVVHDFASCLAAYRARIDAGTIEIWSNGRRAVQSSGTCPVVHFAQRRWPTLAFLAGGATLAFAADTAGLVSAGKIGAAAWFVVVSLILAIAGNLLTSLFKDG